MYSCDPVFIILYIQPFELSQIRQVCTIRYLLQCGVHWELEYLDLHTLIPSFLTSFLPSSLAGLEHYTLHSYVLYMYMYMYITSLFHYFHSIIY